MNYEVEVTQAGTSVDGLYAPKQAVSFSNTCLPHHPLLSGLAEGLQRGYSGAVDAQ